ncbi:MAG TPA: glycosyltransferase family 2 protein [Polyangia bacterium]|nr:glycosyltransferase family 2 protein [Polyangia bacterium]
MQVLFWLLVGTVLWTYAGYPALLVALARFRARDVVREAIEPKVTVIISAYNEEKDIRRKLENTLALDYPPEKLEIVVASDCSTDRTHDIVRELEPRGVRLAVLPERSGKTAAQNLAASMATGEVLVFTDATTQLSPDTVRGLVQGFADPRVGCVGAELAYVSERRSAVGKGGGAYWRYEKKVKELEARVLSLVGVSGCLYAVRAAAYRPIEPELISDFVVAGDVYSRGYITVYGRGTVSQERTHETASKEFDMRVRVIIRTINALVRRGRLLNPLRYRFFAFQIFSHKVLRYLVPQLLLAALLVGLELARSASPYAPLYRALTVGQLVIYGAAALGWLSLKLRLRIPLVHIPFYFVIANVAALWAFVRYLRGDRKVTWNTVR